MTGESLDENMKGKERQVKEINEATERVGSFLHLDNVETLHRVIILENKFDREIPQLVKDMDEYRTDLHDLRKELKGELKDLTITLTVMKESIPRGFIKGVGTIASIIIILFGGFFTWIWEEERNRASQLVENSKMLGQALGTQKEISEGLKAFVLTVDGRLNSSTQELTNKLKEQDTNHKEWINLVIGKKSKREEEE